MLTRPKGFTLIELLIGLAVLGILLMIGVPEFRLWIANIQVRNAAESIQNGMKLARMEALRRNTPVTFSLVSLTDPSVMDNSCALSSSGISWVVSLDNPAGACGSAPIGQDAVNPAAPGIIQKHVGAAGNRTATVAATTSASGAATQVTFTGLGRVADPTNNIARVAINSSVDSTNARKLEVRITSGGSVNMCDPAVTDAADPRKC